MRDAVLVVLMVKDTLAVAVRLRVLVVDTEGVRVRVEEGDADGVRLAVEVAVAVAEDVAVEVGLGDATHTSPTPLPESLAWSGLATGMQLHPWVTTAPATKNTALTA